MYADKLVSDTVPVMELTETEKKHTAVKKESWKYLGNNQKKILVGVNYADAIHLPDAQLDFLMQLLKACQLSLNDVAVVNRSNYTDHSYTEMLDYFGATVILLFGITAQEFGFPFETPHYQVQQYAGYTVLHAPALEKLQDDKPAKGKLWAGLKTMFNLWP